MASNASTRKKHREKQKKTKTVKFKCHPEVKANHNEIHRQINPANPKRKGNRKRPCMGESGGEDSPDHELPQNKKKEKERKRGKVMRT